ncbi:rod shape-determining protein MreD [Synechococcus sp. CS-205]|uniref:rod shape-determining protein MreD n=1 Tax=Synechococcus sp. CS-205 TaxID=2847984 RepID=UPI00223AEE58|nr:rod shape-determining protein MreD [Synechococcus sp. CS-205]MCT0247783.1 rod shape-determining protein MreD [Synechococcus sp. CS-205]
MGSLHRRPVFVLSALVVPLLTLAAPGFLRLGGVPPSWAVIWLLPWSLVDGPLSGALAGLALGLMLDALHLGSATQMPALALLGWWWGRLPRRRPPIERSFSLGLLAMLGSAVLGLSVLLQRQWSSGWESLLTAASLHTLLAQVLVTALLAPMICSLLLLLWRRHSATARG